MIDLKAVVEQVIALTRPHCVARTAQGKAVDVIASIDEAVPAIQGDESEIREALVNLILNALDAMPAGGTIRVRLRPLERTQHDGLRTSVGISVEDDGVGMDETTRRRCMEPFFILARV